MSKSKFWAVLTPAILVIALILAACGPQNAPTDSATPTATAPTTAQGVQPPAHPPPAPPRPPPGGVPAGAASPLISAADLITLIDQDHPRLRVVDLGSADEYAAGHIPGAMHVDWSELNVTDSSAASIAAWQKQVADLLGQRGIANYYRVIIYDHGTLYGARLWWVLDQLGHSKKQ